MPLFRCSKCGCIENTAVSHYAIQRLEKKPPLCSECNPEIGKWHGRFPKESAEGHLLGDDNFLYNKEGVEGGYWDWNLEHKVFKIMGELKKDGSLKPYKWRKKKK